METGIRSLTSTDLRVTTLRAQETLGAVGATADGRKFRYVKADTVAGLAEGHLGVAAAPDANHQNCSLAATSLTAVGTQVVTVTVAGSAVTDQYAGGYLVVRSGAGAGAAYRINGNTEVTGAGDVQVTLYDAVATALDVATSVVDLVNPFSEVLATTTLSAPVGVATVEILPAHHGWVQTSGWSSVLVDGVVGPGQGVCQSNAVAGAVEIFGDSTSLVGTTLNTTVDTEYETVNLCIA